MVIDVDYIIAKLLTYITFKKGNVRVVHINDHQPIKLQCFDWLVVIDVDYIIAKGFLKF